MLVHKPMGQTKLDEGHFVLAYKIAVHSAIPEKRNYVQCYLWLSSEPLLNWLAAPRDQGIIGRITARLCLYEGSGGLEGAVTI